MTKHAQKEDVCEKYIDPFEKCTINCTYQGKDFSEYENIVKIWAFF